MPESQGADKPHSPTETTGQTPPAIRTPSPDATESELKLSRKREREASLEPATTPSASNQDVDPLARDRKDSRTPLKKNRRRLAPTEEEEDGGSASRSGSGSPPTTIMASPRQEMKIRVRQISQGVEDISWKNMHAVTSDKDEDVELACEAPTASLEPAPDLENKVEDKVLNYTMQDEEESPPKTPDDLVLSRSVSEYVQAVRDADTKMLPESPLAPNLHVGSENGEKGLKRKFLERGTSQGPPEDRETPTHPTEPLKRPRDEADKDDNPRETKRITPPPSPPRPSPPSPKISKQSGFMAYASSSSPFASVKGQNIFGSAKAATPPPPSFTSSPAATATPLSAFTRSLAPSPSLTPTPAMGSGFGAYSSTSSPFASAARMKSPVLGSTSKLFRAKSPPRKTNPNLSTNPFASYVGSSQSFALPATKRARPGSPDGSSRSSMERNQSVGVFGGSTNGSDSSQEDDRDDQPSSFGEKLRAGIDESAEAKSDDEQPKIQLTEQDVMTGEEEEETLHQVRGKLFSLHESTWKERGTGLLKLNVNRIDGNGARLVMRKDAVYTLLLNVTLFPGMRCVLAQDPRYLRFSVIESGVTTTYNLKVANAKIAQDLLEEINSNIPT
ncbi:hypothetical protein B0H34DRAFT_796628 [Crassisporium funariophilum]|nr:hypothetical protein B0H34DRAFT_796628 [Crassisporium funariophilum]